MKSEIKKICLMGGCLIHELGPVNDVVLFFDCLNYFVADRFPRQGWSLLTDRLYRRYLKYDELYAAGDLMDKVKAVFDDTNRAEVEWSEKTQIDKNRTWLDTKQETLGMVFSKFFIAFDKVKSCAISDRKEFGSYSPVRLSVSNFFYFSMEEMRPLSQYEELGAEDEPFWLMPESMAYKFLEEKK